MFRGLREFLRAVIRHWSSLVTGGVVIALMTVWQGTGHKIPPALYWVIAAAALFVACFKAWEEERSAKESALRQIASAQSQANSTQTENLWQQLFAQKKRLEEELEVELDRLQTLQPTLTSGMGPDDPNAFYFTSEWQENEYWKVNRKIDRIREDLEIIKEKLRSAPQKQ